MASTNINILTNTHKWLVDNNQTHRWLAEKMGISDVYMSQLFNQKRALLPKHIETISKVTGIPIAKLAKNETELENQTYIVQGNTSNEAGRKALIQALIDANRYVDYVSNREEETK